MVDFQIKKIVSFGSVCKAAFKTIGSMLFNVPKRILKAAFRIQMEIAYLPFRFISSVYRLIFKMEKLPDTRYTCSVLKSSDQGQEHSMDASSKSCKDDDATGQGVKQIHTTAPKIVGRYTAAEYVQKSEILKKHVQKLLEELRIEMGLPSSPANEIAKTVQCQSLQTKGTQLSHDYRSNATEVISETVPVINRALSDIGCQEKPNMDVFKNLGKSKIENIREYLNYLRQGPSEDGTPLNEKQVLNLSIEVLQSLVNIVTQEIAFLKRRLSTTNCKMEEILQSSGNLFQELSKLNEQVNKLSILNSRITDLQNELRAGRKLLQAVETDRNEMQLKLLALERMIKEEEDYLDDVSCESGYDEFEIFATSPFKDEL